MDDLLLINPPLIHSVLKHAGDELPEIELLIEDNLISSINVGLLSIASYLVSKGFSVKILDMYKAKDMTELENELRQNSYRFVGISCVTCYSYLATLECFEIIKRLAPDTITIGGGPHIGPLGKVAIEDCASLDIIARYEGELVMELLLTREKLSTIGGIVYRDHELIKENSIPSPIVDLNDLPPYNFPLYPNFLSYMPFIEESRGCFAKCNYCVNRFINHGRIRYKSPENFERDAAEAVKLYGRDRRYIIESLSFGVNPKNTVAILDRLKNVQIEWGAEFRADGQWSKYLKQMHEAGCRMIDIGIESASPTMLKLMKKTTNPNKYLLFASGLIKKAIEFPGMFLSYNVLFFLGETPATMRETTEFIFSHQSPNVMISVFPVFIYPGVPLISELPYFEEKYGSKVIDRGFWHKIHAYPINLSHSVSFHEALIYGKMLQRMFLPENRNKSKSLIEKTVM